MGKKPSYWKKLSPILKDANEFRDQKLFKESIRTFYEAIDFISLKDKDLEDKTKEIKKMKERLVRNFLNVLLGITIFICIVYVILKIAIYCAKDSNISYKYDKNHVM